MEKTYSSENSNKTFRFVGLSTLLHITAAGLLAFYVTQIIQKPEMPPITEIEILSAPSAPALGGEPLPSVADSPVSATPTAPAPAPERTSSQDEVVVAKAPKALPTKATQQAKAKASVSNAAANLPPVAVVQRAEVEAPNFETADVGEVPVVVTPDFDEALINDDFAAVDNKVAEQSRDELAAAKKAADEHASQMLVDQEQKLSAIEQEQAEEAAQMAAIAAKNRAEEKARIAALASAEKAAADQAAQERARASAAAAAAAAAAKAAAQAKAEAAGAGEGAGQNPKVLAGQGSGGIRGIEDLRQMPGNKRPNYDQEDRFQGRQGVVVFNAYVTKDGRLTGFQIVQSTGHRSLDYKTLKALKEWKFYPGQEGTVEIPFQWDLKGGPQEMPTGLRTKVSQSQRPSDLRN